MARPTDCPADTPLRSTLGQDPLGRNPCKTVEILENAILVLEHRYAFIALSVVGPPTGADRWRSICGRSGDRRSPPAPGSFPAIAAQASRITLNAPTRLTPITRENAASEQRMQAQRDADRREYARLVEKAKAAQLSGQFDTALAALFSARRIQPGDDAERLIALARSAQARALAQQKGTVNDLEARLTSDTAARTKLEAQIKRNQNFYSEAMNAADQALRFRQYDRAIKQFQNALKLIRSEVALEGLRQALDEQAQAKSAADMEAQRASTDRRGENEAARLLIVGRADFDAGKFDEAFLSFRRAKELAPTNADAIAWLAKAEKARLEQRTSQRTQPTTSTGTSTKANTAKTEADQGEKARREDENTAKNRGETKPAADPATRLREDFNRLVEQGRTALANRRFEDAQKALDNALRLVPGDKEAERLLLQARDGAQPIVTYTRHLQAASALEKQEKFAEALQEYKEALKALPNDPAAMKRADFVLHMDVGMRLFKDNKKSESAKEFEAALKIAPDDAAAKTWLRQTKNP
jgi:tetratricopeptide (TPR) repeat protein